VLCAVCCVLCAVCCVLCAVFCVLCAVCCVLCTVCCVLCAVCCVLCAVCCESNGLWGTTGSDDSVWCCSDENEIHSSEQKTYALQQCGEIDYVLQLTE
jgi:hypothetical protein